MVRSVYGQRLREQLRVRSNFRLGEGLGPGYGSTSRAFQTAEDIIPIAELKANMSEIVRGLGDRPRPLVITLNGKPAAVVMSPQEYDSLSYRSRFLEAVNEGLADTAGGRTYDGEEVVDELMAEIKQGERKQDERKQDERKQDKRKPKKPRSARAR